MTHTRPMPESAGEFDEWQPEEGYACRKCGGGNVKSREWESSCGGYVDYKFRCDDCGHTWWAEGADA